MTDETKQRLFIDMDGTLAVFKPVDQLETLYEQGYFENLEPHENVLAAVKNIMSEHPDIEVHILSAYLTDSPYALQEKNAWLNRYLPEIDQEHRVFVACGSDKKEGIQGGIRSNDFLLDDYTVNLNDWQPPARGIKLLNAINHTRGSWEYDRIRYDRTPEELAQGIVDIMHNEKQIFDDKVQKNESEGMNMEYQENRMKSAPTVLAEKVVDFFSKYDANNTFTNKEEVTEKLLQSRGSKYMLSINQLAEKNPDIQEEAAALNQEIMDYEKYSAPINESAVKKMNALGYEQVKINGFQDDYIIWNKQGNPGLELSFGLDGWGKVDTFLDNYKSNENLKNLFHQIGMSEFADRVEQITTSQSDYTECVEYLQREKRDLYVARESTIGNLYLQYTDRYETLEEILNEMYEIKEFANGMEKEMPQEVNERPGLDEYRKQVRAIYDYEVANNIPENYRMTKWYDEMNVAVAKPWYMENDPSVMDGKIGYIPISEASIGARYAEIEREQRERNISLAADKEPLVDIYNLEYDEDGYLHFTVAADDYELEGLYRIYDPENGDSMTLVNIDYGNLHPIIERQWDRIEHALYDATIDRYKAIVNESSNEMTQEKIYKYYFNQNSISQGSYPIENFVGITEYEKLTHVSEINQNVLGELRYREPLTKEQEREFGLISSPSNIHENETAQKTQTPTSNMSKYRGYLNYKDGYSIVSGESAEEILQKVNKMNARRNPEYQYKVCNIGHLDAEQGKYIDYQKYDVITGKNISPVILDIPNGLTKAEFTNLINEFKQNGARFNAHTKKWYIEQEQKKDFEKYLSHDSEKPHPTEQEQKEQPEPEKESTQNTTAHVQGQEEGKSVINLISGIENEYIINLVGGDEIRISQREVLEHAGAKSMDELSATQIVGILDKTVQEHIKYTQSVEYDISVSKDAYDNRCNVYTKSGQLIELRGDQFGVHFPSMEAAEVKEIVDNYMQHRNQEPIVEQEKPTYAPGEKVSVYIPDYAVNKDGIQEICGMKHISGEVQSASGEELHIKGSDGNVITVSQMYDERQANVMERAIQMELKPLEMDLVGQPKLNAAQMEQVLNGIKDGLSCNQVALYANPNVPASDMDIYRYGMNNGIPYDNIADVIKENLVKVTAWEDSRNMVDKMVKAQRNLIIKDLKDNHLRPEKQLVKKIEKLNGLTNRINHVGDITSKIGIGGMSTDSEIGSLLKDIGNEINHQKVQLAKSAASVKMESKIPCR